MTDRAKAANSDPPMYLLVVSERAHLPGVQVESAVEYLLAAGDVDTLIHEVTLSHEPVVSVLRHTPQATTEDEIRDELVAEVARLARQHPAYRVRALRARAVAA